MFYTKYGRITERNPIWVQGALRTLMRMHDWVGPYTNMWNTKYMTFTLSFIWWQLGKNTYNRWAMGKSATFQGWKRTILSCRN